MQDAFREFAAPIGRKLKQLVAPAVVLATLAGQPLSLTFADEAPARVATRAGDSTSSGATKKHALSPAIKAAAKSRNLAAQLKDYKFTFTKKEVIKGELIQQKMTMKFRQEPHSVYVKYIAPHPGREVIYVDGQNQGKLLVHEDGFKSLAGTLAFSPTAEQVMRENKYPITNAGMVNMLDAVSAIWRTELNYGECELQYFPQASIDGSPCKMYEVKHPVAREHFKFHKTRLYIDIKTGLPVRVEQYAFPEAGAEARLVEEYTFSNVQTNLGMSDNDFSTKNKSYNF